LAGHKGISVAFKTWAGFHNVQKRYLPPNVVAELDSWTASSDTRKGTWEGHSSTPQNAVSADEMSILLSKSFYHAMFPGACSGGYDHEDDLLDLYSTVSGVSMNGVPEAFSRGMCEYVEAQKDKAKKDSTYTANDPFSE